MGQQFHFSKHPVLVNSIFLKMAEYFYQNPRTYQNTRIEQLGKIGTGKNSRISLTTVTSIVGINHTETRITNCQENQGKIGLVIIVKTPRIWWFSDGYMLAIDSP